MRRRAAGRAGGFTLVELLVVVAVLALLLATLLPTLRAAKRRAAQTYCLSNLRQLATASVVYTSSNDDRYPVAEYRVVSGDTLETVAWDFAQTTVFGAATGRAVRPGLLWQGETIEAVQQCPSYEGGANWLDDPYTGYNYNTSYVGSYRRGFGGSPAIRPARTVDIRRPSECAVFGDGEYVNGANKFMRAPWSNPRDAHFTGRSAGTQGYRHRGETNVAFADGHARSWEARFAETYAFDVDNVAAGTGFLAADNSPYDLE